MSLDMIKAKKQGASMKKALTIITLYFFPLIAQECEILRQKRELIAQELNKNNYSFYSTAKASLENGNVNNTPFSKVLESQAKLLDLMFKSGDLSNESETEKQAKKKIIELLYKELECRAREEEK